MFLYHVHSFYISSAILIRTLENIYIVSIALLKKLMVAKHFCTVLYVSRTIKKNILAQGVQMFRTQEMLSPKGAMQSNDKKVIKSAASIIL